MTITSAAGSVAPGRWWSVISVANLSPQTHGGILDTLYTDPDILISCTYQPLLPDLISAKATTRLEQTLEESAGGKIAAQLQEAAEDLQMGQMGFGDSQTIVTVYAATPDALKRKVTAVTAILRSKKLKIVVEKQGLAGVDAVTGATISSHAVMNAAAKAMAKGTE